METFVEIKLSNLIKKFFMETCGNFYGNLLWKFIMETYYGNFCGNKIIKFNKKIFLWKLVETFFDKI